jgi:preprotein translocase subunit SecD
MKVLVTGNNRGKRLEIVLSGQLLTSAVIEAQVDSGRILIGKWDSPKETIRVVEDLLLDSSQ